MNLNLYNKTFLISGSSKGIGLKIAESLLNEGANTIITGRSKKLVKKQFNKLPSWTWINNKEIKISSTEIRKQRLILRGKDH